jgi:hypothetical protein
MKRKPVRPCIFSWCGKRAKVLKHGLKHGTNEPYFCSQQHAAWWALARIHDQQVWCEKGGHYAEDGCNEHDDENGS